MGLLIIASIFILGMQYGKRIEMANKSIINLLTITPTPQINLPVDPALTFSVYTHEGCGIGFTRPTQFKTIKETSIGATLKHNNQILSFECPVKQVDDLGKSENLTATTSVILGNKKIEGYTEGQNVRFITDHPYKKTPVIFSIDNNLLPLIQSTLQFTK